MEIINIVVTGARSLTLPYQEVQIMPIGDVQLGQQGTKKKKLRNCIKWALDQGNVYFISMGDLVDGVSPSNRQSLRSAALYDTARGMMQDAANRQIDEFLNLIKGSENKWLGMLGGDHFFEFDDGSTSDTRIAQAMKAPYLGSCAFLRLAFERAGSISQSAVIWAHHGKGNGLMPHAPLNTLYHIMHQFEAHIYIIGHQHKKPAVKIPYLSVSRLPPYRIVNHNRILAGTGGFFEGYHQGSVAPGTNMPRGSYVEEQLLAPVAIGTILLKIRPVHNGHGSDRIDMNCEI